tara:strand:+ start:581 stop:766 length:186 start_codon:yes stop_codon:yes gene_type:complete
MALLSNLALRNFEKLLGLSIFRKSAGSIFQHFAAWKENCLNDFDLGIDRSQFSLLLLPPDI